MDCHTGRKRVGYSKCPKQEGSFGFTLGIYHLWFIQKGGREGGKRDDPIQAQMDTQKLRKVLLESPASPAPHNEFIIPRLGTAGYR